MTSPSMQPTGSWVLTGLEAAARAERSICGRAIAADPAVAEGLAMAGGRAASLSDAPRAEATRDLHASCVHHVGSDDLHASSGFQLAAGTVQEVVDQCLIAHRISQRLGSSGICSMHLSVADGLGLVQLPADDVIASVLSAQPVNGGSNDPGAMLAIAREAFDRVSEATGRSAALVERVGDAGAATVIVGSGSRGVWARKVAAALTTAGHPTAALTVRLVHPFPAEELRKAVGAAKTVLVADGEGLTELSSALEGIEVVRIADITALAGRYPAEAVEAAGAGLRDEELPARILVAPAGPWADATLRTAMQTMSARGDVRFGTTEHDAVAALRWSFEGVQQDVLIASGPEVLRPDVLGQLQPGTAVAVLHGGSSDQEFVDALNDGQRDLLKALGCSVFWMRTDLGTDAIGAALPALLGKGSADGLNAVSADALAAATIREVQFQEPEFRLRRLAVEDTDVHDAWAKHIRSFHWRGLAPVATGPAPGMPLQPTAFHAIAELPSPYPMVVEAGGPLLEVIEAAAEGRGRILTDNLHRLVAAIEGALSSETNSSSLGAAYGAGSKSLIAELDLPEPDASEFSADLVALAESLNLFSSLIGIGHDTSLQLHVQLATRARKEHRERFSTDLRALAERIRDALLVETAGAGKNASQLTDAMSGPSSMFDTGALAALHTGMPGSVALPADARARLEAAVGAIETWLGSTPTDVVCIHAPGVSVPLPASACRVHADPLAAAIGFYDGLARETANLHRAVRSALLDLERHYDTTVHDDALAELSWEGFTASELAIVPAVLAVCSSHQLGPRGLGSMSMLVRSGRPVQAHITVETGRDADRDLPGMHDDIAGLAVAHREAVVVQTSLARPAHLAAGLDRMVNALRPSVAVVNVPASSPRSLRMLRAEASLWGRAAACFTFDPDSGESWSERLDLDGTPDPEQAWPTSAVFWDEDGEEQGADIPATWADRAALEPAYRDHFLVIPPAAWDDNQVPLARYLETFDAEASAPCFPYITVTDADDCLQRAVVTRAMAMVARDHQRAWRTLQELGGFDNRYVEEAASVARAEALAELDERVGQVEATHAVELDQVRSDTARESMERLAAVLMNVDSLPAAPSARPAAAPAAEVADAPVADVEEAPAVVEEEDDDMSFDEPYIDTPMCTTCDECTNLNGMMFKYNPDKQAYIADLGAGTFLELVRAAEACPARCIHTGKPPAGESDDLVARAAEFK